MLLQKSGDTISLIVEDNGAGFDPAKLSTRREAGHGFGLIGMQERTALISGSFEIESAPGSGTSILVKIPTNNERWYKSDDFNSHYGIISTTHSARQMVIRH